MTQDDQRASNMQQKSPQKQLLAMDLKTRQSTMPIAMANKRMIASAKQERPTYAPSPHHMRQMAKLSAACNSTTKDKAKSSGAGGLTIQIPSAFGDAASGPGSSIRSVAKAGSKTPNKSTSGSGITRLSPLPRPQTSGAFKARKIEKTRFRYFYDRGDLPLRVNFAGAVRKIQWQVDLTQLDYSHYLPMFMEGLRELDEPYHFLAMNGTLDLIEKGGQRTLASIPQLVLPMKQNLMTRNHMILCLQMKVLQKLVIHCPMAGEALVPYYRQLLSIFNLFITKRVNCGDAIDYGQRRQENLGDLIIETLNLLEETGGPDAFVNIKYEHLVLTVM